jgi:hypothetical protein
MTVLRLERALEWDSAAKPAVFEHIQWPVPPFVVVAKNRFGNSRGPRVTVVNPTDAWK